MFFGSTHWLSSLHAAQCPPLPRHGTAWCVPSKNSVQLAERLPNGELIPLYTDAGHGGIFQYHEEFVPKVLDFLKP